MTRKAKRAGTLCDGVFLGNKSLSAALNEMKDWPEEAERAVKEFEAATDPLYPESEGGWNKIEKLRERLESADPAEDELTP